MLFRKKKIALFLICTLLDVSALYAENLSETLDDLDLEDLLNVQVVSSASKYTQSSLEAPSATSVITRDQIQKLGYRTLSEIIQGVRSFYVTNDYNYSYNGVRGFGRPSDYDTRILVLLNGHRLNDPVYSSATMGNDFIVDIDLIEKIEIIRGPSSSIYGTNAFFAVVNIFTRKGATVDGTEISGDTAKYDTYQGRATYGKKVDNIDFLLSATGMDSHGERNIFFNEFNDADTNFGNANNINSEHSKSFFTQVSNDTLSFQSGLVERTKQIPTAAFETMFNSDDTWNTDTRFFSNLLYTNKFKENTIESRLYYDFYQFEAHYDYSESDIDADQLINKDFSEGQRYGVALQNTNKSFKNNTFIVGAEFRNDFIQKQENYDLTPTRIDYLSSIEDEQVLSLFLQDDYKITDWLIVHAGARYDNYLSVDKQINPRVGLILLPDEKSSVKLLYGSAFRAPNSFELFYADPRSQKKPEGLQSEEIETYELVLERFINSNNRISFSAYYYHVDNLIDQLVDQNDNFIVYSNASNVDAQGYELEYETKFSLGWLLRTSYAYQETKDSITNDILTNSPKHAVKSQLIAPLLKETLFLGVEGLFTSSRRTLEGNSVGEFFMCNTTLYSKNILKNLDLSTSIYNIFNQRYYDPGSNELLIDQVPQQKATWRIQATYRF